MIRVESAADAGIHELITTTSGSSERDVKIGDSQMLQLPLGRNVLLVEAAPYLLVAGREGEMLYSQKITGYPQGSSGLAPWRVSVAKRGWETVTVSAGSYRTLCVQIDGERERQDVYWGQDGRFRIVAWYAPEVKRLVKLEHKTWETSSRKLNGDKVLELISFRPPS